MTPPEKHRPDLPEKSAIHKAREDGRASVIDAADKPLAVVMICQAYFRLVASLAMKSADPDQALEAYLGIHNQSARIELDELRKAGL